MDKEQVYITMLGRSVWAVLNSYYAAVREAGMRPARVMVFCEDVYTGQQPVVEQGLLEISEGYGFNPSIRFETVPEADFLASGAAISKFIRECNAAGASVSVDITPGRKALVAGALVPLSRVDVDHIWYFLIRSIEDGGRPFPMIPSMFRSLHDLRGGGKP